MIDILAGLAIGFLLGVAVGEVIMWYAITHVNTENSDKEQAHDT